MPRDNYNKLVEATSELLGPASQRFIDRQIRNHLGKEPGKLNQADLKQLAQWLRLSVGVLTDDEVLLNKYSQVLDELCRKETS